MPMSSATRQTLRPVDVAKRYGVSAEKVIGWIRRGELRGVNVADRRDGRKPRFVIDPADLKAFELSRTPGPAVRPIRRRKSAAGVTEFF
jgi:transposase